MKGKKNKLQPRLFCPSSISFIFEENIVENFPSMEEEIVNQVQEAQRIPYRINPRRNMPRHILIKLTKTKHKERLLKAAREKLQVTYKGNPIHLTADLSAETLWVRRKCQTKPSIVMICMFISSTRVSETKGPPMCSPFFIFQSPRVSAHQALL